MPASSQRHPSAGVERMDPNLFTLQGQQDRLRGASRASTMASTAMTTTPSETIGPSTMKSLNSAVLTPTSTLRSTVDLTGHGTLKPTGTVNLETLSEATSRLLFAPIDPSDPIPPHKYLEIERAKVGENTRAAIEYAGQHKEDAYVQLLLRRVGDMTLLDGCSIPTDPRTFKGLVPILTAIYNAGEATDENLSAIFGDAKNVKGTLLEFVTLGTPVVSFSDQRLAAHPGKHGPHPVGGLMPIPFEKTCDLCEAMEGDPEDENRPNGPKKEIFTCSGCRSARYCSVKCQRQMWKIHKPTCLRLQGQFVPESMHEEANRLYKALVAEKEKFLEGAHQEEVDLDLDRQIAAFVHDMHAWDAAGRRRHVDVDWNGLDKADALARKMGLEPMGREDQTFNPAGINNDSLMCSYRNRETLDMLSIFYTKLYGAAGGNPVGQGAGVGLAIDGMAIKVHAVQHGVSFAGAHGGAGHGGAEWVRVAGPGEKNFEKFLRMLARDPALMHKVENIRMYHHDGIHSE